MVIINLIHAGGNPTITENVKREASVSLNDTSEAMDVVLFGMNTKTNEEGKVMNEYELCKPCRQQIDEKNMCGPCRDEIWTRKSAFAKMTIEAKEDGFELEDCIYSDSEVA